MPHSSSASLYEYDVFLSFRGPDVRRKFADHLYRALRQSGVRVFRDSEELRACQKTVFGLIGRSEIFIPIFSSDYAYSRWSLEEIEKIVKAAGEGEQGRLILPVFYGIDPTHVRNQTGPFEDAFQKYEQDEEGETVKNWREALRKSSMFSDHGSELIFAGDEAALVELVVQRVLGRIKRLSTA